MISFTIRKSVLSLGAIMVTGFLAAGCILDPSEPDTPETVAFSIAPVFARGAGIVDLSHVRVVLTRAGATVPAVDTVVNIQPDADSLSLNLEVTVSSPSEEFELRMAFITPAGDTAFRAGPLTVTPTESEAPVPLEVEAVYTGVGAGAVSVHILDAPPIIPVGNTVELSAEARDAAGEPIPGTPIAWSSLDPDRASVPDPRTGMVIGGPEEGTARIVASLLTSPADTVTVSVTRIEGMVLVLSNCPECNAAILDSFPVYMPNLTFDTMDVFSQTPTVAFLSQYRLVLLYEDGLFDNAPNVGDSVAAYVMAGGNLVIGTFYWQDRSDNQRFTNAGWGALEDIDPFLGPYGSEYRQDSLDVASIVEHPMTQGLDSLWVHQFHGGVVAKPGTTVLARWSDACDLYCDPDENTPLIGYRIEANDQRIVGVSVYPAYPYYSGYRGDFYRLWANVLSWAMAGGQPGLSAVTADVRRSHPVDVDRVEPARGGTLQYRQ